MSLNIKEYKYIMICKYNGIKRSNVKWTNESSCNNMNQSHKFHDTKIKTDTK